MITHIHGVLHEPHYRIWLVGNWFESEIKNSRIEYVTEFRFCPAYRRGLRHRPWWPLLGKELR